MRASSTDQYTLSEACATARVDGNARRTPTLGRSSDRADPTSQNAAIQIAHHTHAWPREQYARSRIPQLISIDSQRGGPDFGDADIFNGCGTRQERAQRTSPERAARRTDTPQLTKPNRHGSLLECSVRCTHDIVEHRKLEPRKKFSNPLCKHTTHT